MTLDAALTLIWPADLRRLRWAFNELQTDYVIIERGPMEYRDLVVGVHLDKVDHLVIIEARGRWALAQRRKS